MNPFGTKSLTNGLGLVAAQPKKLPTMNGLLGNPALLAGLGLLGAARDSRINPYEAALGGVMGAQQFQQSQDMMGLQRQKLESQQQEAASKKAEAQRKAEAMQKYQSMIDAGETPDAVLAYQAGIPVEVYKQQYGGGERKMYKGADGYNYWQDNPTERVNPNVEKPPTAPVVNPYEKAIFDQQIALSTDQVKRERDQAEASAEADKAKEQKDVALMASLQQGASLLSDPRLPDAVGPVDAAWGKLGGKWLGTDDARLTGDLDRFIQNEVLDASSKMKGAITEQEWPRLERTRPSLNAHPSQWVDWYNTVLDAAANSTPHLRNEIEQLRAKVNNSAKQSFDYERLGASQGGVVKFGDLKG